MDKTAKSLLQEFCQKNHLPPPNYRIKEKIGPDGKTGFTAQVDINNRWYQSEEISTKKKTAENLIAQKAFDELNSNLSNDERLQQQLSHETMDEMEQRRHFPEEFADIEDYFVKLIKNDGGRIRRVKTRREKDQFQVEITGNYRYCENVKKHHNQNKIFFVVDVKRRRYAQRCFNRDCEGFQSAFQPIPENRPQ